MTSRSTDGASHRCRTVRAGLSFEHLDAAECWRLIGSHDFGRYAFLGGGRVQVVPRHYRLEASTVYLRASPFGSLARHARRVHGAASLAVDDIDAAGTTGWSVVLSGSSHPVHSAAVLSRLWAPVRQHPWSATAETLWVAFEVEDAQGQRVRADPHAPGSATAEPGPAP